MPTDSTRITTAQLYRDVAKRAKVHAASTETTMIELINRLIRDGLDRAGAEATTTRFRSSEKPTRGRRRGT
jgi:hypothetical protein